MADFLEFGELLCTRRADARGVVRRPLPRGVPDADGEAKRDDEQFSHVAAWEYAGPDKDAGPQRRAADVRERASDGAELQVMTRAGCEVVQAHQVSTACQRHRISC